MAHSALRASRLVLSAVCVDASAVQAQLTAVQTMIDETSSTRDDTYQTTFAVERLTLTEREAILLWAIRDH
jgi:hypothetical protein